MASTQRAARRLLDLRLEPRRRHGVEERHDPDRLASHGSLPEHAGVRHRRPVRDRLVDRRHLRRLDPPPGRRRAIPPLGADDDRRRPSRDRVGELVGGYRPVHGVERESRGRRQPLVPHERLEGVPDLSGAADGGGAAAQVEARRQLEAVVTPAERDRDRARRAAAPARCPGSSRGRTGPERCRRPRRRGRSPRVPAALTTETRVSGRDRPGTTARASALVPASRAKTTAPGGGEG